MFVKRQSVIKHIKNFHILNAMNKLKKSNVIVNGKNGYTSLERIREKWIYFSR